MQSAEQCFSAKFVFPPEVPSQGDIPVDGDCLYLAEAGYGFVTDAKSALGENGGIPEINNGFVPAEHRKGVLPRYFRVRVPHSGNYTVSVTIACEASEDVVLFSERRRFVWKEKAEKGAVLTHTFTANVCPVIPTGKKEPYPDEAVDLTLIGEHATFRRITVEETHSAVTIFLAGDSTVTDQQADSPYLPTESYCGWGQALPLFFRSGATVSNHAHSGFTTEDFLQGGHWEIIKQAMHPGDYVFIQFGHNDEKIPHLAAFSGYRRNLERLIDETKENGGIPVLVTSVSRNLWNAPDGGFNDLLEDWAQACRVIAREKKIALIDLHEKTKRFFYSLGRTHGSEYCRKYFYPGDFTHFNDIGGALIASFVAEEMKKVCPPELSKYLMELPACGEEWKQDPVPEFPAEFDDLAESPEQEAVRELSAKGILRSEGRSFCPDAAYSRVNFLASAFIALIYLPKTAWNNACADVRGDEWYAGNIQAAAENGFLDPELLIGGTFKPDAAILERDALSILVRMLQDKFEIHKRCGMAAEKLNSLDREERIAAVAGAVHLNSWNSGRVLTRARAAALLKQVMAEVLE
ncbi:MAG TPA: rhamnogalacturonan acetylesterase [Clostridiales bacterium]|nr:rhamnogalacturonan acetylesterase [Clostridiales bacterium]